MLIKKCCSQEKIHYNKVRNVTRDTKSNQEAYREVQT